MTELPEIPEMSIGTLEEDGIVVRISGPALRDPKRHVSVSVSSFPVDETGDADETVEGGGTD